MNSFSSSTSVSLGLVQMSMVDDPDVNLNRALSGIREAATRGADIVCLPELFRSPYFCVTESCPTDYAEPVPGKTGEALSRIAAEYKITVIGGSVYEQAPEGRFNTALVYNSEGTLLGQYRKTHIPHDPAFYEQNYFGSGDGGYKVFETEIRGQKIKLGVLICYDQWFPEAARTLALMGADIIFYPTAIGTVHGVAQNEGDWHDAWRTAQRGHAITNATIVAAVNRVGQEHNSVFWGGSFVADAFGRVLAEGTTKEEIVLAPVDIAHNKFVKDSWRFFAERRPDTYGHVTKPVNK